MVRALLATLAALSLVGVLSILIIESRAVNEEYYVAHAQRMRAIEASGNDIAVIAQDAESAFGEGRTIPSSVELAFARLAENSSLLGSLAATSAADPDVQSRLLAYDEGLKQFAANGQAFAARQNALAAALRILQEESPVVVKELRRLELGDASQIAFSLAVDVIEFAIGQNQADPDQIVRRIDALRYDLADVSDAPGQFDAFTAAAGSVIEEGAAAKSALDEIGTSSVAAELSLLSTAVLNGNRLIVSRVERARLLLAVCAVLLLVGAGYAMLRLQSSYRALNKSNTELAEVNSTLEQRVETRTGELSSAYDELKESQVQLVQAEKMSSLGELVAGISHEINTPLWYLMNNSTVIQERLGNIGEFLKIAEKMIDAARTRKLVKETVSAGLIDMDALLTGGMKEDIDEAKDLIQDSIDGLDDLTELAQSLKDFSRLDRAKQGDFDVNDGLNKTLLIVKNKIKDKVTIHKHFGDVPTIFCSPSQVNQVFLNLIVNASDAIADKGDIVLHTWEKDGKVGISVADTGCGIPEDVLPKVRNPFFTTKEIGKGTGLGLSIVDQIVTTHGGELRIESEPGKGTSVTVVFPIEAPDVVDNLDLTVSSGATGSASGPEAGTNLLDPTGDTVCLFENAASGVAAADDATTLNGLDADPGLPGGNDSTRAGNWNIQTDITDLLGNAGNVSDQDLPVLHKESTTENGEAPDVSDSAADSLPILHDDLTAKNRSHG